MARITVEDCIKKVPNRFDLVILAAQRSRQIASGAPLTIDRDNEKNPVLALREIASGSVNVDDLKTGSIQGFRHYQSKPDEKEEELEAILSEDKFQKTKNIEIGSSDEEPSPSSEESGDVG